MTMASFMGFLATGLVQEGDFRHRRVVEYSAACDNSAI